MKRHLSLPRENWQSKVEEIGFSFHTLQGIPYWDESVYYEFSYPQVEVLERSTADLYRLCLEAVDYVLRKDLLDYFYIPKEFKRIIKRSWQLETPSIYGRFDLSWDGDIHGHPKMLEFNADTPTSLFEAAVVQWFWLKDLHEKGDQFNSIHEKLIGWWKKIRPHLNNEKLFFSCLQEFPEDVINVSYLQDCASQAGIKTAFINVHDIGLKKATFMDLEEKPIRHIFKLYPWEWMLNEEFGTALLKSDTIWIEPPWKMILSNKAILPVLWKLFPGHPNLLECYFDDPGPLQSYAVKPLLSREGANIILVENGDVLQETPGEYGEEGYIYQQLHKLPNFDGNFPVLGSWVIGGKPAGLGIRETNSLVTDNFSRFIPHSILPHPDSAIW
jgi:glutathionylspermidine synthase